MADHLLLIGWDKAVNGMEQQAVAAFAETVQYYAGLVESGHIESFEPVLLYPHGGDLNGFFLLRGEADKLNSLLDDRDFERMIVKAQRCVDGIGVIKGTTGDALAAQMTIFAEVAAEG